jgi:hypothetical protein
MLHCCTFEKRDVHQMHTVCSYHPHDNKQHLYHTKMQTLSMKAIIPQRTDYYVNNGMLSGMITYNGEDIYRERYETLKEGASLKNIKL